MTIYFIGCGLYLVLGLISIALGWFIPWLTKDNIAAANSRKVLAPVDDFSTRTYLFFGLISVVTSWVGVAVISWQILALIVKVTRNILSPVPEVVQKLRFPMHNNPDMPPESVWAHLTAMSAVIGAGHPDDSQLLRELNAAKGWNPLLNKRKALTELQALAIVNPETIAAALRNLPSE